MSWNQPWKSKQKAQRKGKGARDQEPEQKTGGWFPSYDNMDGSLPSSSVAGGTTNLPQEVITVLQQIAAKDPQAAVTLDAVLPDPGKEEVRERQKQINAIRKTQQKIERKENAVQRREAQMAKFLEEVKNHVAQEKARYAKDMEGLKQEIADAKITLQELKDGKAPRDPAEGEDLDAMLEADCDLTRENRDLKEQLKQMEQNSRLQQTQLYNMQSRMEDFMRHYMDQARDPHAPVAPKNMEATPGTSPPLTGNGVEMITEENGLAGMATPATPARKPIVGPFRTGMAPKPRTSPYGKDGLLEAMDR